MNSSCNSSFGDLISQEPRWTPFHERISASTVERSTDSPIAKKKLGFKGLLDEAGSTSNIEDVIGVCSGKFETQDTTLSQTAVGASGDLLPQQQKLSPNISDLWPLNKTRDDFHESQDIEDYEDELIHDPPIKGHGNIDNKQSADEGIVEAEEEFEIAAKKTNNSFNDVCSIICGSVKSIPKTLLKPYSRVASISMERKEMKHAILDKFFDIQDTNTRQMGDGLKGRKHLKDCTECMVGKANSSGQGAPVVKTKSYKQVWGKNTRTGLYGWKRRYGPVVELVKPEELDSSGSGLKSSKEIRNIGEARGSTDIKC